jgi:predicted GNAT family N-acyltransferase
MAESMTRAQRKLIQDEGAAPVKHGKHRLDELNAARVARHLVLFRPTEAAVTELMKKARLSIPGMAETPDVLRVFRHNPECMFGVARKSKFNATEPDGDGLIFTLPLNMLGLQHLALGTLNALKPDVRLLAKPQERPAGIYLWAVYAPGPLAASMALLMEKLASDLYAGLHIYARPATDDGRRFSQVLGFTLGASIGDIESPNLWVFTRKSALPLYDSYSPGADKKAIGITVARTSEDMMRVAAIRNSVYIGEQECPYEEEYDGNDFSATHLLAYIGNEPVGCLRLRFFADFAKFERMAIRKEFRKSRAAIQLARAGFKFCQKKGYRRVYGHIQERLIGFWSRFGFRVMEGGKKFAFSDFDYVEIVADIERDPDAVTIGADPYILIRPEGRWHVPGILERSALRAGTRAPAVRRV